MTRRRGARLYRLALHAFPPGHRAAYGHEMIDAFIAAREARRREQGRWAALRFLIAACLDAVRAGLGERRRYRVRASRDRTAWRSMPSAIARDLAYAVRSLTRARGFSFVTVVSLGIGIGTVLMLLLFVRVVVGTPPGVAGHGLVELLVIPQDSLRARVGDWAIDTWSYPDFEEVRRADTGITVAGWTPGTAVLRASNGPGARVDTMYVSPNYFHLLDARMSRGPGFAHDEQTAAPEVIVSYRTWRNRLGADPAVVGSTILVNGTHHVVVGVTPEEFRGHLAQHRPGFELWLPLAHHPHLSGRDSLRFRRDVDWVQMIGQLAPHKTRLEANAVVATIMAGLAQREPATNALKSASVEPYYPMGARRRTDILGEASVVLIGACLVLLVVCLNVSGMVLVRSAARERELAVRLAIGASRGRLIQQLLSEAVVLAIAGGALGGAVIFGIPAAVSWWTGSSLDDLGQMRLDASALAMCVGVCLATSIVFGLLPAVRFSRPKVMSALKDDAGGGRRVGRMHRWTAALQAGIAVPFLVVGAVQLEQFRATAAADLGFDPAGLFALPLDLAAANPRSGDAEFVLRSVQAQLAQTNGVASVSLANGLPLDSDSRHTRVSHPDAAAPVRAHTTRVSAGHLKTMGIPLLRGRDITTDDRAGGEPVVLISQALATRLFANGEAVGQRLTFAMTGSHTSGDIRWAQQSLPSAEQTFTVIGITADVVDAYIGPAEPQLFVPLAQHPAARVYVIARSSAAPQAMASAFESALTGLYADPDVLSANVVTGDRLVRRSRSELAMWSGLSAIAGGAALLLAALGIFGVVGFMVATRTREIGIRIALGASRARVLRDVLTDAVKLALWGVAGGLALALAWASEISWASLGGIEPLFYAAAVAIALGVALLAGLPAARRAAAVEPITAMRAE